MPSTHVLGFWRCIYDPNGVFHGGYFRLVDIRFGLQFANWADGTQFLNERTHQVLIISDGQMEIMSAEEALLVLIPESGG